MKGAQRKVVVDRVDHIAHTEKNMTSNMICLRRSTALLC